MLFETNSSFLSSITQHTGVALPSIIITFLFLILKYHDRLIFTHPARKGLYQPKGYPLLGNSLDVIGGTENQLEKSHETAKTSDTGCFRATVFGAGSFLVLSRPEYIEYVQRTNFNNFEKGEKLRSVFSDLLGTTGIFVADGANWKHSRKTASNIFSAGQFRTWIQSTLHGELDNVVSLLDEASSISESQGNQIAMPELFSRYTLSSFSKMAFSKDVGCLTGSKDCLTTPVKFGDSFDYAQTIVHWRLSNPIWKLLELWNEKGRKMKQSVKDVHDFAGEIVEARVSERIALNSGDEKASMNSERRTAEKDGKDLLDLFMDHTLDKQELRFNLLHLLIAGRDTTFQTLSWFFYELVLHPEHVEKIRVEVNSLLGSPSDNVKLAYEQMKSLPYLQACIAETLRLHPPVPRNSKKALDDDLIIPQGPNKDNLPAFKIYKGEIVAWSDWSMNRLKSVYGEDAEEFNPERFLEKDQSGDLRYVQPNQWKFHVFNGGYRLCLGMNLAFYETMAFSAAVLPRYDFEWVKDQEAKWPLQYLPSITHPTVPYIMSVKKAKTLD